MKLFTRITRWTISPALVLRVPAFALAMALVISIAASPATEAGASEQQADGDLLSDVRIQHQISFGDSVQVQVEASVNFDVAEVRAVFGAVGERRVSSYAYPEFRLSGDQLNADFSFRTGGSAYFPPSTEFDVAFEITDVDGRTISTPAERILYLDPARDWRSISAPDIPLVFYYYGVSESAVDRLISRTRNDWQEIAATIGIDVEPGAYRAVIYPNVRAMTDVFPPTSDAASDGVFFGGFAMQRFGVFVLGGVSEDSVIHELTHLLIDTKVSSPLSPGVPSWLHEGLAQFFEAGSSDFYTSQLGTAARNDRLLTLRNRNTVPARAGEISLYYVQVGSFVGQLIEDYGPEPMSETLRLINEGSSASEAMEQAYERALWELENQWRVSLGASALPSPPATPTPELQADPPSSSSSAPPTAIPQASATVTDPLTDAGIVVDGDSAGDGAGTGFNWTGPLIGAVAAATVFVIWSFRVNRRRYRGTRR